MERTIKGSTDTYMIHIPMKSEADTEARTYQKYLASKGNDIKEQFTAYRFIRLTSNLLSIKDIESQVGILGSLSHPNIQNLYDVIIDNDDLYAIYDKEFFSLTSIIDKNAKLSENLSRQIFFHILSALIYLHSQKIAHLDINPDNIFFNKRNIAFLGSFFKASRVSENSTFINPPGVANFMPPEVFTGQPYDPYKVDVWSLGITLLLCLTNTTPYEADTYDGVVNLIKTTDPIIESFIPQGAKDVLKACFKRNPAERPTAAEIYQMPWVKSYIIYPNLDVQRIENPFSNETSKAINYHLTIKNKSIDDIKCIISSGVSPAAHCFKIVYDDNSKLINIKFKGTESILLIKYDFVLDVAHILFKIQSGDKSGEMQKLLKRIFEEFSIG